MSAFSIIIKFALGKSIPTSITVVETNIEIFDNKVLAIQSLSYQEGALRPLVYSLIQNTVLSQEVEQIIPELVRTDLSGEKYKSIAYGNVTALLVEAVKELRQEVNELRSQIETLKK